MSRFAMILLAAFGLAFAAVPVQAAPRLSPPLRPSTQGCDSAADAWAGPALANAVSVYAMEWSPFGTLEIGWETYVPLLQRELNTVCAPGTADFASALARWQGRHTAPPTGIFDVTTFQVLKGVLQERRPFVMSRTRNECPDPPPISDLVYLSPQEEHADRLTRLLRRDTLDAYRAMVAAARRELPAMGIDPELLQIFSGWRDPAEDAARCAVDKNCDGVRRAVCSPHRTGAAVDLYVGHLEGLGVDDTSPPSRRFMTQGPVYRWLVANADRFGFVPYVYEPWHWEYVGASTR